MPPSTPSENPTLRTLLRRSDLGLRLEGTEADLDKGALDRPVRWVHNSDLADPTPFLAEGLALLTTGTQFLADDAATYDDYVARLHARGVYGLGFGTEVVRDGIPPGLAAACRAQRMPLFEVPYRTPFIAVARANAEAVAAQAYARRSWALAAQRAVALAALRPDGLSATLAELARRLDAWVGLFDAAGALVDAHPAPLDSAVSTALSAEVATVLRRGAAAAAAMRTAGAGFTVQTLGRGGHLRGVLAIGADDLDQEARGVVTAVVAMAELSFAQSERFAAATAELRSALWESLRAGDPSVARAVAARLRAPLPEEPVAVLVLIADDEAVTETIDTHGEAAFHAADGDTAVVVASADGALAEALSARFGGVGVSAPSAYADLGRAHAQAQQALRAADGDVSRFTDMAASGILAGIDAAGPRLRAEAFLAPLRAHDTAHEGALEETLRTWLAHDARFDAAAEALGVHRHTVRARIAQAARLLGVDLAGFPARADAWAALLLAEH